MAIAAAIHGVLLGISALLSRPLKLDAVEQVNVIYSNAAALVIPLVRALLGDEYVIYSCAFIIVQLILLWTHASSLLQGDRALDWKKFFQHQYDRHCGRCAAVLVPCGAACAAAEHHEYHG